MRDENIIIFLFNIGILCANRLDNIAYRVYEDFNCKKLSNYTLFELNLYLQGIRDELICSGYDVPELSSLIGYVEEVYQNPELASVLTCVVAPKRKEYLPNHRYPIGVASIDIDFEGDIDWGDTALAGAELLAGVLLIVIPHPLSRVIGLYIMQSGYSTIKENIREKARLNDLNRKNMEAEDCD